MLIVFAWIIGLAGAAIVLSVLLLGDNFVQGEKQGEGIVAGIGLCILGMVLHHI